MLIKVKIRKRGHFFLFVFFVGGAARAAEPPGRKGGTPTLGWWHCPRHGARPFRERYAPPHLPLEALCGPSGGGFGFCWSIGNNGTDLVVWLYLSHCLQSIVYLAHIVVVHGILDCNSSGYILWGKY